MIYFIKQNKTGPIKIGFTERLKARISGLQTANSEKLILLGTIGGNRYIEKQIHQHLRFYHSMACWLVGQWEKKDNPRAKRADRYALAAKIAEGKGKRIDVDEGGKEMRFIQFLSGQDWYTIEEITNGHFDVKRQGDGDYERYETDEEGMEKLKATATGKII